MRETHGQHRSAPAASTSRGRGKVEVPEEIRQQIARLHAYYGSRQIAERVALSRKVVRRVLKELGCLEAHPQAAPSGKLEPFQLIIEERVSRGLTISRILREIRQQGYRGGRSILAEYVRRLQSQLALKPRKAVKRRFETPPAEEMQIDWSPFRLCIAGRFRTVYAFGCLACASRKLWVHFYRDERQSTLLEALACAFEYFVGCALRVVLDNMATAVLGRYGPHGQPIWHPRFLDFARHYGFQPFACAVRDPDRKGKEEKSFRLLWDDFLKGSQFDSLEDLNRRVAIWLDETPRVGNLRVHGTTRLVPNEAWLSEKQFLIQLPDKRFPVFEESVRLVDQDSSLSVDGTRYTVPCALAGHSVAVHLFAEHFEVLDRHHRVLFARRYAPEADKGKLIVDPTHYAQLKSSRNASGGKRLQDAFLIRFPSLAPFVSGLQLRMKSLAPVHIRALLRLADCYGEEPFLQAVQRAQEYRRFDAGAVQRILERHAPPPDADPLAPFSGVGGTLIAEVDSGSLDDYHALDVVPAPTPTSARDPQEGPHGS